MTRTECRAAAMRLWFAECIGVHVPKDHFRDLPQVEQMRWKKAVRDLDQTTALYLSVYDGQEPDDGPP